MHPRSKHWHLLDYGIVRVCDQKDVRITRAMRGKGAFSTDHRLVRSIMNIRLASKYCRHKKRYDITFQQKKKEYQCVKVETQKKIRDIEYQWCEYKAKKIQGFADQHDMHTFFQGTKAIYELGSNNLTPFQSQEGTLLNFST